MSHKLMAPSQYSSARVVVVSDKGRRKRKGTSGTSDSLFLRYFSESGKKNRNSHQERE
jgi:hypothetical protein